jgi:hypothetical protein
MGADSSRLREDIKSIGYCEKASEEILKWYCPYVRQTKEQKKRKCSTESKTQ